MTLKGSQVQPTQMRLPGIYYTQNVKSQRQKQKFEQSKKKTTHRMQGNPYKAFSRVLSRNLAGQEGVGLWGEKGGSIINLTSPGPKLTSQGDLIINS